MSGFDFDKTIYKKDSSVGFYLFLIRRHPYLLIHLVIFSFNYCLYLLKIKKKHETKEKMFSIVKYIKDIDMEIDIFWNNKHLERWYLDIQKQNDVVISASPLFLLKPFLNRNNINNVIATNIDKKTGKIIGVNCYGIEKVNMYKDKYPNKKLKVFYTDSKSDESMILVSDKVINIKK